MSVHRQSDNASKFRPAQFRGRLSVSIFLLLLLLFLIPVGIMGGVTYIRSRQLLAEQASNQLKTIVTSQAQQFQLIEIPGQKALTDLFVQGDIGKTLINLRDNPNNFQNQLKANNYLNKYLSSTGNSSTNVFDKLWVVLPDGKVISSTDRTWIGQNLSGVSAINEINGTNHSVTVYDPLPLYQNQLVTFSAVTIVSDSGERFATIIGAIPTSSSLGILSAASSFFPSSKAYILTLDDNIIGVTTTGQGLVPLQYNQAHIDEIHYLLQKGEGSGQYISREKTPVLAYAKNIPTLKVSLVLEVPLDVIYQQINALGRLFLLVLVLTIGVSIIAGYIGTISISRPLRKLAANASSFANGDWSQRASVNRRDEIGLLAHTFNLMVEQLSELYRVLEQKVEERTQQLRTASEIAQLATSTVHRDEIFSNTTRLLVDRFGYNQVAIYLLDELSGFITLSAESGLENRDSHSGYKYRVIPETPLGWVVANNQAKVFPDSKEETFNPEVLSSSTVTEAAIPISIGTQVLGILHIQSSTQGVFDPETVSILRSLANQIATGIQNIHILESTQINLEETSLLYRSSRSITQAHDETEAIEQLDLTLAQTPYVNAIYSVEEGYISILAVNDPKNPNARKTVQGITLPLQKITSTLSRNSVFIVNDTTQPSEIDGILSFFSRRNCNSVAIFGVYSGERLSKVVALGSREPGPILEATLQPYANLMEVFGSTLERFSILKSLEQRLKELQTLTTISQAISEEINIHNLFRILHHQVINTVGDVGFVITLINQQTKMIDVPYIAEEGEVGSLDSFPLGQGLTSIIIRDRKPLLLVKDAMRKAHEMGAKIVGKPSKSWLGIPLIVGGEVIGAMILQDTEKENRFSEMDLLLFARLAPQIATAIRNAQLLSEMQQTLLAYEQERFLLNSLMDNIPDQVFFVNPQGEYIRASQSYTKRIKMESPDRIIGRTDSEILNREQAEINITKIQNIKETGIPEIGIVEKTITEGKEEWFVNSRLPLKNPDGEIAGILGISHDISELKIAEELAQKRANQLQISSEIARETTATLQIDELLSKAVELILERFKFYHAAIFLLDPSGEYAVLRESTGDAGMKMKLEGHKLSVGSKSIVGQTAFRGHPLVINDVFKDSTFFPNPLLPDTRSEMALPLKVGSQILGVLDVQSTETNAFSPDDVGVLQILADQLAGAVLNARLFGRANENLALNTALNQITNAAAASTTVEEALTITVEGLWKINNENQVAILFPDSEGLYRIRASAGFEGVDLTRISIRNGQGIIGKTIEEKKPCLIKDKRLENDQTTLDDNNLSQIVIPISYRDAVLGILELENRGIASFDEADLLILSSLGNSLGTILYNNQLLQEIRRQVERERQLFEITSKIRRSVDMQTILQTSVNEIAQALRVHRARIEISPELLNKEAIPSVSDNGHDVEHENEEDSA